MRIVAGALKGRRLVAPKGRGVRPTLEMVREAVFDVLGPRVAGARVLDLFAGSGAMGIEALSRGAARCTFVERDRDALRALRANVQALGLEARATIVTSDEMAWVPAMRGVDLALVDPPYTFDAWPALLGLVQVDYVLCESAREVPAPDGWQTVRAKKYGRTAVTLLTRP